VTLKGKRALVTGGTRGIGKAIVLDFASKGADIVFTYHSAVDAAKDVGQEAGKYGNKVYSIQADAGNFSKAEEVVKFALEKLGGLDILVNNAGINKDNLLLRMSEEDFDSVIAANLKSVFNYCKASVKPMISQKSGKIINISSVVAIIGNPGQTNYVASKSGVIGFTKALAKELASRNINVNSVAPGYIATDMTDKMNDTQKETINSFIPLKRIGDAEEIAKVVSFLSSSDSNYITGQVIAVDGGLSM
jgi:3-oxoacyl-[acyl-carrier protein] reductase